MSFRHPIVQTTLAIIGAFSIGLLSLIALGKLTLWYNDQLPSTPLAERAKSLAAPSPRVSKGSPAPPALQAPPQSAHPKNVDSPPVPSQAVMASATRAFQAAQQLLQAGHRGPSEAQLDAVVQLLDTRAQGFPLPSLVSEHGQILFMALLQRVQLWAQADRHADMVKEIDQMMVAVARDDLGAEQAQVELQLLALLATAHMQLRAFEKADDALTRAKALIPAVGTPDAALGLQSIEADIAFLRNDKERAIALNRTVVEALGAHFDASHPMLMQRLMKYGYCLFDNGEFDRANEQLERMVDAQVKKSPVDENAFICAQYYAVILFAQENYPLAAKWSAEAVRLLEPVKESITPTSALAMVVKQQFVCSVEEIEAAGGDIPDAWSDLMVPLKQELRDSCLKQAPVRSVTRYLRTVAASFEFVDPATISDSDKAALAQEPAVEKVVKPAEPADEPAAEPASEPAAEQALAKPAVDADEEFNGAASESSDEEEKPVDSNDASIQGENVAIVEDIEEEPKEKGPREFFGKMSITLEIDVHPVTGAKLVAGNHLVASFQHPGQTASTALVSTKTLTQDDVEKSGFDKFLNRAAHADEPKPLSTVVLESPGYFEHARKGAVEVVVDIFESEACETQLGTHVQLLRSPFDTEELLEYAAIARLASAKDNMKKAVARDYGLGAFHLHA